MMSGREGWRSANEDAMSTGSNSSDPERNSPPGSSESILLRMPNVRRVSSLSKPKAVITAIAFTAVVIVGGVFGTLYYSGENGGVKNTALSADHDFMVKDMEDVDYSKEDTSTHSNSGKLMLRPAVEQEYHGNGNGVGAKGPPNALPLVSTQELNSTTPSSTNSGNSTRRSRPRNRNRSNGANHGPRRLPTNAQDVPPFSLLYQMKLVEGSQDSFMRYTECEDHDLDGRRFFKGWKAVLPVNLTAVGISDDHPSTFAGYGTSRRVARRRAAEVALSTLYQGQLEYAGKNDLQNIDQYCTVSTSTTTTATNR